MGRNDGEFVYGIYFIRQFIAGDDRHSTEPSSKKERVSAFETLHEAAREISATGKLQGQRQVNNIFYSWKMEEQLCVEYVDYKEQRRRICIE
ncbi:hypothetical protein B481_3288 [Planococcus halocryophilus Or1]|uniref:hypothetical protein n=1 Tax=Planococcus halocryophilus TaxID=1215089 RepID=UPI0002B865B0|nr:hypothetical protein [Planococcus halocryophilus]EMF45425.1 hypothetical protein B481_3288 [Planococcus halocryophilus Or1]